MAKLAAERNWQMKATYVEVRGFLAQENISDRLDRYTTSNYATFYYQSPYHKVKEQQWRYERIPRAEYS